jgi:hypothetical protein
MIHLTRPDLRHDTTLPTTTLPPPPNTGFYDTRLRDTATHDTRPPRHTTARDTRPRTTPRMGHDAAGRRPHDTRYAWTAPDRRTAADHRGTCWVHLDRLGHRPGTPWGPPGTTSGITLGPGSLGTVLRTKPDAPYRACRVPRDQRTRSLTCHLMPPRTATVPAPAAPACYACLRPRIATFFNLRTRLLARRTRLARALRFRTHAQTAGGSARGQVLVA